MRKKSKQKRRLIDIRHQTYKFNRYMESKERQNRAKNRAFHFDQASNFSEKRHDDYSSRNSYKCLLVPETFDLLNNYDETIGLISDIRTIALKKKQPIKLLFEKVKKIYPAALLLLLAELYRCRAIHGDKRITGTYPNDKEIERMLQLTGFFKLLNIKHRLKDEPKSYPLEYIEFITHVNEAKGTNRQLRNLLFGDDIEMDIQSKHALTRAIGEATLNVIQCAYNRNSAHPSVNGRWWLAGHVDKSNGELMIMFCDLGVGIPYTLPKKYPMEIICSILSLLPGIKPNDGEMIKAGMTIGRSSTLHPYRGKGLNDMRKFISKTQDGELHIFSRNGYYCYKGIDGTEVVNNFNKSIGGTLIKWTVPLDKITNWTG
ncbi:MAG: hypothetical protein ACXV8P_08105 [Methylobacter sp.]